MPAPTPRAPQPVLEMNARPPRDLRALLEKHGDKYVCRQLNVHRTTVRRWLAGRVKIPGHQHQVIKMLLGDLPGTDGKWTGWHFYLGQLVSPAGDTYSAGQVLSLVLLRQQLTAQQQEVERLRIRLAIAENAVERLAPAANEPLASRERA